MDHQPGLHHQQQQQQQQQAPYYTTIPPTEYFPYYSMPNPAFWPGRDDPNIWYTFPPSAPTISSTPNSRSISRASILTPAIVASVALLGSAILLISYYKIFARYCSAWQNFWGLTSSRHDDSSQRLNQSDHQQQQAGWYLAMNRGLDESMVRRIPVYVYRSGEGIAGSQECVVCLGEFEEEDELRILPKCSHAFHVSCIDVWLQSHSNCPLCRAPVICFPPAAQSMERILRPEEEEEQAPPEQAPVLALQIEEDVELSGGGRENDQAALRRSASLRADVKSWWRVVPLLRRSNSTGSSYRDLVLSPASNLILAPHNSAELEKQVSPVHEDGEDGYVVLNIEVASTSSSGGDSPRSSSSSGGGGRLSVRKSLFKAPSLKRSSSSGRVFSFRRFSRSRSVA